MRLNNFLQRIQRAQSKIVSKYRSDTKSRHGIISVLNNFLKSRRFSNILSADLKRGQDREKKSVSFHFKCFSSESRAAQNCYSYVHWWQIQFKIKARSCSSFKRSTQLARNQKHIASVPQFVHFETTIFGNLKHDLAFQKLAISITIWEETLCHYPKQSHRSYSNGYFFLKKVRDYICH